MGVALKAREKERRESTRNRRRTAVRYGTDDVRHLGFTSDFGKEGLFLQGNALYPPNTLLHLQVEMPGGATRTLRGRVRWVKNIPLAFRRTLRGGMGIELIED